MHSRIYVLDNKINNVDTYFDDMDFMDYVQESEDSFEEDMNWIGFKQNQVITKEIAQEYWDDKFEMIKDTELNLKNRYKLKTSLDDNHGFHVVVDGICYSLDELMADIAQGYMKEVTFNVVQILDYHF